MKFLPEKKTAWAHGIESAQVSVPTLIPGSGLQQLRAIRQMKLPFLKLLFPHLSNEVITPTLQDSAGLLAPVAVRMEYTDGPCSVMAYPVTSGSSPW